MNSYLQLTKILQVTSFYGCKTVCLRPEIMHHGVCGMLIVIYIIYTQCYVLCMKVS